MTWQVERWRAIAGLEHGFGDRRTSPPAAVKTLRQVHGRRVFDYAELGEGEGEGDGMASDRTGALVGVWTADCVPLLLVAPAARVAAAVHCGWKGSAAGIVASAVDLFASRWNVGSGEIEAALGPSIGGCCYEVGPEVRDAFVARAGKELGAIGFAARGRRLFLDLRSFLTAELRHLEVTSIEAVGPCTACRTDLLYSYRREGKTGRQLSYIGWRTRSPS
jgi:hypothetical protein